jgi:hypothetical protein
MVTPLKRLGTAICATAIVAALVIPAAAGAKQAFPATGSLYFAKATAKVVGQTALIPVKCVGPKGATCSGTISLGTDSASTEAPFSVTSGGNRTIAVPTTATAGESVVAVAETAQSSGAYQTTTEVLRLR